MKQEIIAGSILCILGLSLVLIPPEKLWIITEKWKTKDGSLPSRGYAVVMRVLGVVFALTGGMLIKMAVKGL
ncbi:MAG: hypothetical protein K6F00_10195 [Lachnospiraceae bacterium]|nr:hypothetical protein [Lachnospiraceae bacterium]